MASDLAHDVQPIFEPLELATRRDRKDRYVAVFAVIAESGYGFATELETRFSVV
jgi:hypothetical protein